MNTVRGVVNVRGFDRTTGEEIVQELASIELIAVRHFRRKLNNGNLVNTNTVTLTFLRPKLPDQIKVCMLVVDVKVFIPNPRRCYRCWKYGHLTKYCRLPENTVICGKCKGDHDTRGCSVGQDQYKCSACPDNAQHSTLDKTCPTFVYQKLICEVMANQNIPFLEAKKQVNPTGETFASVAKVGISGCSCKCSYQAATVSSQ